MSRPSENPSALRRTWLATQILGRFSVSLGGAAAARLWFTPWAVDNSDKARARHARWLEGSQPIELLYPEGKLAGFTAGRGPKVLLVHGWGERAATMGALVQPLVESGYRVIGVDLPAHGDSSGEQSNILMAAEAVGELVDQIGGVHAVIAHSMGGAVTSYALHKGLSAERAVFIAPAVRLENAFDTFMQMTKMPTRAEKGLRQHIERRFGKTVWDDFAVDRLAKEIDMQALVIHDASDEQVPIEDGELLANSWPGARFVRTEGLGHVKLMGDKRVQDEICAFIANEQQGRAEEREPRLSIV